MITASHRPSTLSECIDDAIMELEMARKAVTQERRKFHVREAYASMEDAMSAVYREPDDGEREGGR